MEFLLKKFWFLINILKFKYNNVSYSDFRISGVMHVSNLGKLQIGEHFRGRSGRKQNPIGGDTVLRLIVAKNGNLKIGKKVGISNSTIYCSTSITIGDYVSIGGGCKIWDTDFHPLDYLQRRTTLEGTKSLPILIGNDVFIGAGTIILKGVTIGDRSIIGAGSVVSKSIGSDEVWAGNPIKFIKKLIN